MTLAMLERPAGIFLVALGLALAVLVVAVRGTAVRVLATYERGLGADLGFVGGPSARFVSTAQGLAFSSIACAAFGLDKIALFAFAVPIALAPRLVLAHARASRVRAIEAQLDGWLTALSNGLVSTASLAEALASSTRLVQAPLSAELERLIARVHLGTPLDQALNQLGERVGSPVLSSALLSLRIARSSGGELRPMLARTASALRDVARFEGMVRAKTSEGKAQAVAVSVVPAPLVLAIQIIAPDFFAPLGKSAVGTLIIAAAILLWLAAIGIAAKITAVDV